MTKVHVSNGASNNWAGDEYSQHLIDQVAVMVKKEYSFYACDDYLDELTVSPELIDEGWYVRPLSRMYFTQGLLNASICSTTYRRQKMAEWMFKVIDFYDLDRDIVNVAMAYLDQMFTVSSLHHTRGKQQCSLVTIASLKLAVKLFEPRIMNMDDMLKLGVRLGSSFSSLSVVKMEHEMLWKLRWNMLPPTVFCFAHHMICMFPSEILNSPTRYIVQELSKYMSELAVCVYSFVKFLPSRKSFASCLVALDSLDDDCLIHSDARAIFNERIFHAFGMRHDDTGIRTLMKELKELLCHNTDLKEFIALIRASNKSEHESESPKTAAVKMVPTDV